MQEVIPKEYLEGLHLCLSTGNAAYEDARNCSQNLLLPDGTSRRPLPDPDTWPADATGSIQKESWQKLDSDLQAHVEKVFLSKLRSPFKVSWSTDHNTAQGTRQDLEE
jgi:hypothetical protein